MNGKLVVVHWAVQFRQGRVCVRLGCVRLARAAFELEELLVQLGADDCAWVLEHRWDWPTPSSAGG